MNSYECIDIADDDDGVMNSLDRTRLLNRLRQQKFRARIASLPPDSMSAATTPSFDESDDTQTFAEVDEDSENSRSLVITNAVGDYNNDDDNYYTPRHRNQMYWTPEATRTLIHLRGAREAEFQQGGARKGQLWEEINAKMCELGYNLSVEKISKKWHNILITYNKNIVKKETTGSVNWDFFDDIDVIYKDKRMQMLHYDYEDSMPSPLEPSVSVIPLNVLKRKSIPAAAPTPAFKIERHNNIDSTAKPQQHHQQQQQPQQQPQQQSISNGYVSPVSDFKKFKAIAESEPSNDGMDQSWWKAYFNQKLELDREKMRREHERHKDNMNFQKMALMLQERVEKIKVEAINGLTSAIAKLAEAKHSK